MDPEVTREIPRSQWRHFLDEFSRIHDGWLVTVEVLDRDYGAMTEIERQPLRGLTFDRVEQLDAVTLHVGTRQDHLTRIILDPTHVFHENGSHSTEQALEIEGGDGTRTLLTVYSALPAAMLDPAVE